MIKHIVMWKSKAALDAYQHHPQHAALKPFIAAVRSERQCVDYRVCRWPTRQLVARAMGTFKFLRRLEAADRIR